jgi:hypothetical protein
MKDNVLIAAALLPGLLLLGGCDEKAREFAAKTKAILDQRSVQLTKKIAAEVEAYSAYAALATEDHRSLVSDALANERSERATQLAADYIDGKRRISIWRNALSEYAQVDYDRNKDLLTTDLDASTLYMQRYEALAIEQHKVDALSKLLTALATKQNLKEEIDAVSGFASDTQKELDKKTCEALKGQMTAAAKKLYDDKKCVDVLK